MGYQHFNPHGETALITDESGVQVYSARYDSFGNNLSGGGLGYGYAGKWQRDSDNATGTIRMGVREYDPRAGRFGSVDPLKGTVVDPQQRNRYTFNLNNPRIRYDLNGTSSVLEDLWAGANAYYDLLIPAGPIYQTDNDIINFLKDDPIINLTLATSIAPGFGTAAYSAEMMSFYGGSKLPRLGGGGGPMCSKRQNGSGQIPRLYKPCR